MEEVSSGNTISQAKLAVTMRGKRKKLKNIFINMEKLQFRKNYAIIWKIYADKVYGLKIMKENNYAEQ